MILNKISIDVDGVINSMMPWLKKALDYAEEALIEEMKNEINNWILDNTSAIDFQNEIGCLIKGEYHFKENCDSGDHLHPSKYAYELMGRLAMKKVFKGE